MTTSGCSQAPYKLILAAFSDDGSFVKPMRNPLQIPSNVNCTKPLLGWLPNINFQADAHRGVCTMLAVRADDWR